MNAARFSIGSAALAALLVCAGCATRTEVLLVVDSDIGGVNQVTVDMTSPSGDHQSSSATIGVGDLPFPRTLGLTHSGGALGPYTVVVTGYRSGTILATRTAAFTFVRDETRVLRVDLLGRCTGVRCAADQTCGETGCRPITVAESELEAYSGSIGAHDASSSGPVDAATPADTGTPVDASTCPSPAVQQSDPMNCGMCGNVCRLDHVMDNACAGGRCRVGTCQSGWDDCDGRDSTGCEAEMATDTANCGMCGRRCFGGAPMCCRGSCAASCP